MQSNFKWTDDVTFIINTSYIKNKIYLIIIKINNKQWLDDDVIKQDLDLNQQFPHQYLTILVINVCIMHHI